jgi:hypothetical protein
MRRNASHQTRRNGGGGPAARDDNHESREVGSLRPGNQLVAKLICPKERESEGRTNQSSSAADKQGQAPEFQEISLGHVRTLVTSLVGAHGSRTRTATVAITRRTRRITKS